MLDSALGALLAYGPLALALVVFAGCLGVPLPVTMLLLAAGALVREGLFDATLISPLVLVAVVGDCASYFIGRYGGRLFRKRLEGTPYWDRAEHALQRWGPAAILLTRFLLTPLVATPTNLIAGGKRYAFQKFLLLCLIGDTLKIALFVGLGYLFAESWEAIGASINSLIWWLILGALATLVIYAAHGRWRSRATPAGRKIGVRNCQSHQPSQPHDDETTRKGDSMTQQPEEVRLVPPVGENDCIRGPVDAPITLVEYGDYDCPYAVQAYSVVNGLRERLGDRMRFVYRAYPLTELHAHAQAAAEAAEAAAAQGKFWEMHDKLFEAHRELEGEDLRRYAEEAGLDLPRFERNTTEHEYAGRVRENVESALASAVQETPTFFINGVRHDGSDDLETLLAAMEGKSGEASVQGSR